MLKRCVPSLEICRSFSPASVETQSQDAVILPAKKKKKKKEPVARASVWLVHSGLLQYGGTTYWTPVRETCSLWRYEWFILIQQKHNIF